MIACLKHLNKWNEVLHCRWWPSGSFGVFGGESTPSPWVARDWTRWTNITPTVTLQKSMLHTNYKYFFNLLINYSIATCAVVLTAFSPLEVFSVSHPVILAFIMEKNDKQPQWALSTNVENLAKFVDRLVWAANVRGLRPLHGKYRTRGHFDCCGMSYSSNIEKINVSSEYNLII